MVFLGELSALLTACLWSGSSLAFASATRRVGSFQVNVTRLILAAGYLIILVALAGLDIRLSRSQIFYLSVSGVVGLSLGDTFLFKAYREIGARITMLIMSFAPAIAALLAYFALGESLSSRGIAGIVVTIAGISIVVMERSPDGSPKVLLTTLGIVCALLAAAGQGAGLVFAKMAFRESEINGFVATAFRILAGLAAILPFALVTKRYANPLQAFSGEKMAFLLTVLGSILGPFLGITASLIAVAHTDVGIASTIMATVPILMLPLVRIFGKERLSWRAFAGASVAVAGVAMLFLR